MDTDTELRDCRARLQAAEEKLVTTQSLLDNERAIHGQTRKLHMEAIERANKAEGASIPNSPVSGDPKPPPPIDNEHVKVGARQFSEAEIALNRSPSPGGDKLTLDEIRELVLEQGRQVAEHGDNISYPSRIAAQFVRNVVASLVRQLEITYAQLKARRENDDELRGSADMWKDQALRAQADLAEINEAMLAYYGATAQSYTEALEWYRLNRGTLRDHQS